MTYPDVVQLAVPFFIVASAGERAWIVIKGRGMWPRGFYWGLWLMGSSCGFGR